MQQDAEDGIGEDDEDGIDEITILNRFFAQKWNRLSFVYNFSQTSGYYTQQPAFMKYVLVMFAVC